MPSGSNATPAATTPTAKPGSNQPRRGAIATEPSECSCISLQHADVSNQRDRRYGESNRCTEADQFGQRRG